MRLGILSTYLLILHKYSMMPVLQRHENNRVKALHHSIEFGPIRQARIFLVYCSPFPYHQNTVHVVMEANATTMRAVAWYGQPYNVSVIDADLPSVINQTDVVVRITSSAICGSDLHFYHGYGGSPNVPWGLGHEAVGYVSEFGDAVTTLNVGDYVIIPDNADDGQWGPAHPLSFGTGFNGGDYYVVRIC